jgi:hypothetical protein
MYLQKVFNSCFICDCNTQKFLVVIDKPRTKDLEMLKLFQLCIVLSIVGLVRVKNVSFLNNLILKYKVRLRLANNCLVAAICSVISIDKCFWYLAKFLTIFNRTKIWKIWGISEIIKFCQNYENISGFFVGRTNSPVIAFN